MIQLAAFETLPLDQKAERVWQQGTFLDCQMLECYSVSLYAVSLYAVSLYALGDFYVKLRYDPVKNRIVDLQAFKDTSRLTPYLDKITIEGIKLEDHVSISYEKIINGDFLSDSHPPKCLQSPIGVIRFPF
jgi:hypothetical protein